MFGGRRLLAEVLVGLTALGGQLVPASTPVSASPPTVTLTIADAGSAIPVHVGDTIAVRLAQPIWTWSAPTTSDPAVLRGGTTRHHRHRHGGTSGRGDVRA